MVNRKLCLIDSQLGEMLVAQIAHELKNFTLYMSFANYFSSEGVSNLETYYRKRAAEEKVHHDWIVDYLSEADYVFTYPAIEVNSPEELSTKDRIDPFNATIKREIETTELIYKIYDKALELKDYMTTSWLYEKLIKEQIEEENLSRMATSIMEAEGGSIFQKATLILALLP